MNLQAKIDWIGTPKSYLYKDDDMTYDATSIDFSIEQDDNRYKLLILKHDEKTHYKMIQYGVKPGSQKPFPIDIPFRTDMLPFINKILQDPYVQAVLS
ncbi:DUF3910 family protein [Bacillus cytotoxicus]|uniref:Group-specific protein n=2 Tax=Bacillus cytotoxicus TaxID=580165 RepID=A0AAX2CN95_9BACI|nr:MULTISPECIES: DUF3910 family protein [Bacillus cereus group]ABS23965.1 group-specific protein [Bacillus cytotoxicus NVH 391-98]AWC30533.1 hypothetical protein CG483_020860 [Bacillus cytotoxicus]AWC34587.1 hypothetical protein CG482_020875 [Bacillus cytotoxicus]AWC38585.1 hypothetical protein CG481_020715 [Bacillus cytotoxicus]AWC42675.1 hypothetical protein CG480_020880 [Bacillus cytotoxicus]